MDRKKEAVQVKGWSEKIPGIAKTEDIVFPSAVVDENKKSTFFHSIKYLESENIKFRNKVKNYSQYLGRDLESYMLVIPNSKIDFATGEPAPEIVEFFKKEFG